MGIGTDAPATVLHTKGTSGTETISGVSTNVVAKFEADGNNGGHLIINGTGASATGVTTVLNRVNGGDLAFAVRNASVNSEAMRIDNLGRLLVGKDVSSFSATGCELLASGSVNVTTDTVTPINLNRTAAGEVVAFYVNTVKQGLITQPASGAPSFASASDERLKDNITDHESELANVMSLRPTRWDWKDEARGSGEGFIAQELEATAWSDLVSEGEDGYKTVAGLGVVETRLIKAIQEQQAMIETLQAEVAALKGA